MPPTVLTSPHSPRLYQPFAFCDLETIAVAAVLFGLFHLLLALPLYYMDISLPALYLLPFCVGTVLTAAGSLGVACEKAPSRLLLQGCTYTNAAAAAGALCAVCVYRPSLNVVCNVTSEEYVSAARCPNNILSNFFSAMMTTLLLYDLVSLVLHLLLSFSAWRGLRTN